MGEKKVLLMSFVAVMMMTGCHENIHERAERECREYTERYCPVAVDTYVVNDSMVYERANRTIHYYYSLRGEADNPSLPFDKVSSQMLESVRNSPDLKRFKEEDFCFRYSYYSTKQKGKMLFDVLFTPEDYGTKSK